MPGMTTLNEYPVSGRNNVSRVEMLKDITFLLAVSWLVRAAVLAVLPEDAISIDLLSWNYVAQQLKHGNNPYHTTSVLNWPPVWIQIIFALSRIASLVSISLTRAIQCFLIVVESLSLVATYFYVRRFFPEAPVKKILLFGISLNPILVFQVCQHGNFDVMVGLWVVLFAYFLSSYLTSADPMDWLLACMFVGIGIVTKTTPLMLVPLCLPAVRSLSWKSRLLGAFLIFFPVCLGIGTLYALTPADISEKVLGYRSISKWFGITGILDLIPYRGQDLIRIYVKISPWLFLAFLIAMSRYVLKRTAISRRLLVWLTLLLFLSVITFGPGYGSQYIGWIMPLLLIAYAAEDKSTQTTFTIMFGVAIATYAIEYALFPSHGAFLIKNNPSPSLQHLSATFSTLPAQTVIRLPLFYCYILLFRLGWRRLKDR